MTSDATPATTAQADENSTSRPALPALTGLRFLAAFSVFIAHALPKIMPFQNAQPRWHFLLSSASGIGMPLFFVLSGFVIQYNYGHTLFKNPTRGVREFFIARFARVYQLYFLYVTFELIYEYGYAQSRDSLDVVLPFYATMTQSWVYMVPGENSLIYYFGGAVPVTWSISVEWFFYCLYPFVALLILRFSGGKKLKYLIIIFIIIMLTLSMNYVLRHENAIDEYALKHYGKIATTTNYQDSLSRWLVYFCPLANLLIFLIGSLTASIYLDNRIKIASAREQRWGGFATWACFIDIGVVFCGKYSHTMIPGLPMRSLYAADTLLILLIAGLLYGCARYTSQIAKAMSADWLMLCGEASYSLYILHIPVIFAFRWESAAITSFRVAVADFERLLLTIGAAVGLSLISYATIERPARRWLVSMLSRRRKSTVAPQPLVPLPPVLDQDTNFGDLPRSG